MADAILNRPHDPPEPSPSERRARQIFLIQVDATCREMRRCARMLGEMGWTPFAEQFIDMARQLDQHPAVTQASKP